MKNRIKFYQCDHCGNVIHFASDAGNAVTCCHRQMRALKENTADAMPEKHIPVVVRSEDGLKVTIGTEGHPMTPEHHIDWIAVVQAEKTQFITLENTAQPEAAFTVAPGNVKIYAYCNLHGLWSTELKENAESSTRHIHSALLS